MVFPLRTRAPPANSNQSTALERSPASGGAEALTAPWAVRETAASIAQMYILRACRGKSPCPLCRLRAEDRRPRAAGRRVECEVSPQ